MTEAKRHLLSVTMRQDLYQAAKDAAAARDLPVTAWVRELVVAELARLKKPTT